MEFSLSFDDLKLIIEKTENIEKNKVNEVLTTEIPNISSSLFGLIIPTIKEWGSFVNIVSELFCSNLGSIIEKKKEKFENFVDPISKKLMKEPVLLRCSGTIHCKEEYLKYVKEKGRCVCGKCKDLKEPGKKLVKSEKVKKEMELFYTNFFNEAIGFIELAFRFFNFDTPSGKLLESLQQLFESGVELVQSNPNHGFMELYEKFSDQFPNHSKPEILSVYRRIIFNELLAEKQWHKVFPYYQKYFANVMRSEEKEKFFLKLLKLKRVPQEEEIRKSLFELYEETKQTKKILKLTRSSVVSTFSPEIIRSFLNYLKSVDETVRQKEVETILKHCDTDEKISAFLTPAFRYFKSDTFVSNYVMKLFMTKSRSSTEEDEEGEGEGEDSNIFKDLFGQLEERLNVYLVQYMKQVTTDNENQRTRIEGLQLSLSNFMTKTVTLNMKNQVTIKNLELAVSDLTKKNKDLESQLKKMKSSQSSRNSNDNNNNNNVTRNDLRGFRREIMEEMKSIFSSQKAKTSTPPSRHTRNPIISGVGRRATKRTSMMDDWDDDKEDDDDDDDDDLYSRRDSGFSGYGKPREPVKKRTEISSSSKKYGFGSRGNDSYNDSRRKKPSRIDELSDDDDEDDERFRQLSSSSASRNSRGGERRRIGGRDSNNKSMKPSTTTSSNKSVKNKQQQKTQKKKKKRSYDINEYDDYFENEEFTRFERGGSNSRSNKSTTLIKNKLSDDDKTKTTTSSLLSEEDDDETESDDVLEQQESDGDDDDHNKKNKNKKGIKSAGSGKKQRSVIVTFVSGAIPKRVKAANLRNAFKVCGFVEYVYFDPLLSSALVVFYDEEGSRNAAKMKNGKKLCGEEMMCQISDLVGVEIPINNTVVIEGLKPEDDEEGMRSIFGSVCGKENIVNVKMEKNRGRCYIDFKTAESRTKGFALDGTKLSSKAVMDIYPTGTGPRGASIRYNRADFGVIVTGLERYTMKRNIKTFFRTCGLVMRVDFNPSKDTAFVDFQSTNAVEAALEKTEKKIKNKKVSIFRYTKEAHKDHMQRKGRFRRR